MTAEAAQDQLVTVEDYLAAERASTQKHEYLCGVVYGMAGAGNRHNRIATNIVVAIGAQLRGKNCQPFNSDTKVRLRRFEDIRFYYPDAQIVCRQNPLDDAFQDEPVVVFEVVSDSTRRTDEQEKRVAYCSIPSMAAYVVVEQERAAAIVWRRAPIGFTREEYAGLDAVLPFPEVEVQLALRDVFEGALDTP
ncbi:MAG: Uma2 family endonuclease [Chthoniobacteraceae bacterium]